MTDLSRLRRLCAEATPGSWWHDERHEGWINRRDDDRRVASTTASRECGQNAAYIAFFHPVRVAAMIAVIEAARQASFNAREMGYEGMTENLDDVLHALDKEIEP